MVLRRRTGHGSVIVTVGALIVSLLIAPSASANELSGVARMQACTPPSAAFVSLGAAPEVQGAIPLTAGMHRLWDLGVAWKDVNPAPGVFDWKTLDAEVAQVEESGSKPLLVLGMTPGWAAADPSAGDPRWGLGTASPPRETAYWRDYVTAVVDRYGARIPAYQIWNEANLGTFWSGNPEQMAQLTEEAFDIIKAKQPEAIVVAPSIGLRLAARMRNFTKAFMGALSTRGFPVDALAIHTYPAGTGGPADRVALVTEWQNVVVESVGATSPVLDLPVWDTEVNYGLAGPGPRPGRSFTDAEAAALIRQTYADSLSLGIDATFWYLYTAAPFPVLGAQLWSGAPDALAAWASVARAFAPGSPCALTAPTPDRFAVDSQLALQSRTVQSGTASVSTGQASGQALEVKDGRVGGTDWSISLQETVAGSTESITITVTGQMPQSPVYLWSGDRFGAYLLTDGSGSGSAVIKETNVQSVQVNGFTPSGEVRSVTVSLAPPRQQYPKKPVVVKFSDATLKPKSQRQLASLAEGSAATDSAVIRVVAPTKKDARIRARSIQDFLVDSGFEGEISTTTRVRASNRASVRFTN